ncbi:nuclear pore complex protein Nup50 isoform X3 [Ambystoma mexicanum]
MAKRIAEKELTDRNWDQEEDTEEAGIFSVASEDVLKGRAIKKAKRRNIGLETESGGAFKGFKGLALPTSGGFSGFGASTGAKSLDILSNGNGSMSTNLSFTNMKATTETKTALAGSLTANGTTSTLAEKNTGCTKANGETPHPATSVCNQRKNSNSSDYNKQLAALNCSVRDWIVKHVDSNPLCDLTPIFRDYEKYLASIDQKFGSSTESESESDGGKKSTRSIATFGTSQKEQGSTFSFNKENSSANQLDRLPEKKSESSGAASKISFNFGQKVDSPVLGSFGAGAAAAFSFSSGNHSEPVTPKFSIKVPESQSESENVDKEKDGNEDSEEPPKAIVNEVKEDDAFYSKKCKLFYKKDNEYKEKGVGTLHLKPVGNKKTQLLVRADTNLGNILLNVLVQPSMACSRTGKNNVIVLCIPNPPIDEKNPNVPVTMLIRVKTSDDADELLKMLNEKKEEWSSQ